MEEAVTKQRTNAVSLDHFYLLIIFSPSLFFLSSSSNDLPRVHSPSTSLVRQEARNCPPKISTGIPSLAVGGIVNNMDSHEYIQGLHFLCVFVKYPSLSTHNVGLLKICKLKS